ncbi:MAG: dienelactone hydrolase family protein [Gemmatimonadetes bacterium]|nr:MAG: dienelactone hydrolase family protein [Gemmatimonadota bacterium]
MIRVSVIVGLIWAMVMPVSAKIVTKVVEYQHDDQTMEGFLAYDDAIEGKRPGVLICHQWKGLGDYERMRAKMLAEMGYVAFAADVYGQGVRPSTNEDAGKTASQFYQNRQLLRDRANLGLEQLRQNERVDPQQLAAIGYCFGGTTVLELARSGAELKGVVSFHGGLSTPHPEDAKQIRAKVLVLHGADDPYVPMEDVIAFQNEMKAAHVDWQFIAYGGAVHAFTDKNAGDDPSRGAAYNKKADLRSWEAMKIFFNEIFNSESLK